MPNFEFDENKSSINQEKHGIDFLDAQKLWNDDDRLVVPAKDLDEPRFLLIAIFERRHWSAIFTIRAKKIRLISVRRSRKNEIEIYESN
jgi:uncharacterized DUF497 family protein